MALMVFPNGYPYGCLLLCYIIAATIYQIAVYHDYPCFYEIVVMAFLMVAVMVIILLTLGCIDDHATVFQIFIVVILLLYFSLHLIRYILSQLIILYALSNGYCDGS